MCASDGRNIFSYSYCLLTFHQKYPPYGKSPGTYPGDFFGICYSSGRKSSGSFKQNRRASLKSTDVFRRGGTVPPSILERLSVPIPIISAISFLDKPWLCLNSLTLRQKTINSFISHIRQLPPYSFFVITAPLQTIIVKNFVQNKNGEIMTH